MSMRSERHGLTLVETVVTIVVLVVLGTLLLALLLPATRRSREAPRRNQCMNKMKQLCLALQNYHEAYKKFPATSNQGNDGGVASVWWPAPGSAAASGAIPSAGYTTDAGTTEATAGYSWIVMILPYTDEANLYSNDFSRLGKIHGRRVHALRRGGDQGRRHDHGREVLGDADCRRDHDHQALCHGAVG